MKKYFVQQKGPDGEVICGMFTAQQIIDMYGCRDFTERECSVYDVSVFGDVVKLEHRQDSFGEPLYHRFILPKTLGGATVFSGFSPEH